MKAHRFTTLMTIGLFLLPLAGCDSAHEKAMEKQISYTNDFADILDGIKSNTDFVDAKPKLERLGAQMKDLANQVKDLPTPTADEKKALTKEYDAEEQKAADRIESNMKRLQKIGVSPFEVMSALKFDPSEFMK